MTKIIRNVSLESTQIYTNGIRLHVVQAGPASGSPVILLHGFPEFWYGWRHQIGPLAEAGYRVLAPDQRGYNLSQKPKGVSAYRLDVLAGDIAGLMDQSGYSRASVIGHDWGGAVAWALAALHPGRVEHLVILNAPYPPAALRTLPSHPEQILRSAYIFFFQLPLIPEAILRNRDWQILAAALRRSSRPGTFTHEDLERYRSAWWREGAMRAMLNWYRALVRCPARLPLSPTLRMPTLMLWGAHDPALGRELAEASIRLCENGRLVFFENATHWVQHEEAESVNRSILDFLAK